MNRAPRHLIAAAAALATLRATVIAAPAAAQQVAQHVAQAGDTVRYADLLAAATSADPRQRQIALHESASALRLRSIAAERLPSIAIDGRGQYQSAVTSIAAPIPGAVIPVPPHDTYDAHLAAEQALLDPTLDARRYVERARLAESRAAVRASLFGLRQELTESFFSAASLRERIGETDAAIADLESRLREMVIRFREGAALRGDTASIAASLAERRQDRLALAGDRGAALARLALLAGRPIADDVVLAVPATSAVARDLARSADTLRARPEYEQFAAARDRLAQQSRLASAQEKPRLSAFGRVGYGRPGLDMLATDFQGYWLAGVQLHWTPLRWGAASRDREQLEVEREIVATNQAAFARSLERAVQPAVATIARLDSTLATDDRIVALRTQVLEEAQAQLHEGVITAAVYVDRSTELLTARLRRAQHRVALEQARVTLLNTLGVEVR